MVRMDEYKKQTFWRLIHVAPHTGDAETTHMSISEAVGHWDCIRIVAHRSGGERVVCSLAAERVFPRKVHAHIAFPNRPISSLETKT